MLFSQLVPALFLNVTAILPVRIGDIATGSILNYADVITGSLTSEPGFSPAISAKVTRGGDFLTADPSGQVLRLNINALIQTNDNPPEFLRATATGIEIPTQAVNELVGGVPGAKPVNYGDFYAASVWSFSAATTGGKYAALQNSLFVASTALRAGSQNGTFFIGFKIEKVLSTPTNIGV